MGKVPYDPEHIARFFDEYGEREWERFDATAMDRVNLEVHLRLLREYVQPGNRVLDAGAGPGRFSLELARLGARVVAGDISPAQLELHAERTAEVEDAIEARELLDIVDLGRFSDASFDATVCYGGPLSYVLGGADTALGELLRVTKPGGHVLVSVMSLLGAARAFFSFFPEMIEGFGWQRAVEDIFATRRPGGRRQPRPRLSPLPLDRPPATGRPSPVSHRRGLRVELPLGPERDLGRPLPRARGRGLP